MTAPRPCFTAKPDSSMIQAYVVWMAIIYVVVNLITDILYHVLDPRIRLGVQAG